MYTGMINVLLIDNNVSFRQALGKILKSQFPFIAIKEAYDEASGLDKTHTFLPHLVFLDLNLPGGDMLELISKIKRINPDIIIIVFTSYDLPEYRAAIHESGADYFFPKDSWTGEEILALVKSELPEQDIDFHGIAGSA